MSLKLSRRKNWLTLEDSAKYLSLLTNEEVVTTDLLQMALQGDLTLSINLVNSYPAQIGPKIPVREARLYRTPLLSDLVKGKPIEEIQGDEKLIFVDALTTAMLKNYHASPDATEEAAILISQVATRAAGDSKAHAAVHFKGDLMPDYSGVLEFDRDTIHGITGIWDLPMVGSESLNIQDRFYGDIDGPGIDWVKLSGVILKHPSTNRWANLVEQFKDGHDEITPQDYCPCADLPDREPIVIRLEELQRFADSLNEPEATPPAGETDTELKRTQRTLAALAIGLAGKYPAYKNGRKPNAAQLARVATDHLRDATSDRTPHGFSETTARLTIAEALKACPDLANT